MKICKTICPTCPFRHDSKYSYLSAELAMSALSEASRICHSTGSNAINARTGKKPMLCRGARNVQLGYLAAIGFLSEPTDAAWAEKCKQLNIKQDEQSTNKPRRRS